MKIGRGILAAVSSLFDNRISLQKLEIFCLVVELGGVSRAAEHLIVAQPVVTAHIRSLQDRLGVTLLYREGRRMKMTEGGERVYAWATETLSRTRELSREIDGLNDGRRGAAAISASMSLGSYVLPPVLARFREARPRARITLSISNPEQATTAVESGASDFAVVLSEPVPWRDTLTAELVGYDEVVLVAAPDALPREDQISIGELETLPLITSPRDSRRQIIIDRELQRHGVSTDNVVMELGHSEAMKLVAAEGLGASLLFRSSTAVELESGKLREIQLDDVTLLVPVHMVMRRQKQLSPVQEDLFNAVKEHLQSNLAQSPDGGGAEESAQPDLSPAA